MKPKQKLRKIPIVISKCNDNGCKKWRAEIADNYENYKQQVYDKINFEDLSFHFKHNTETHPNDNLVFSKRKDAMECARYVNKTNLNNKAKIWIL